MSKLRRRLRALGRTRAGVGFALAGRAPDRPSQVLVIAELGGAGEVAAAVAAGADALVVPAADVAGAVAAAGDRPVGTRLEAATPDAVVAAVAAGADFFFFDDGRTAAAALIAAAGADRRADVGRVLLLGDDRGEERLRQVALLDLDAVLVPAPAAGLTVREQLALRRVAELTGAPLLMDAGGVPDAIMLETWRDAGGPLVLVHGAAAVAPARESAAAVQPPRRPREQSTPIVPSMGHAEGHDHDDDL